MLASERLWTSSIMSCSICAHLCIIHFLLPLTQPSIYLQLLENPATFLSSPKFSHTRSACSRSPSPPRSKSPLSPPRSLSPDTPEHYYPERTSPDLSPIRLSPSPQSALGVGQSSERSGGVMWQVNVIAVLYSIYLFWICSNFDRHLLFL